MCSLPSLDDLHPKPQPLQSSTSQKKQMEELQEADILWPWTETTPSLEEEDYLPDPELYEYDATVVDFSCELFSETAASSSSNLTMSAPLSDWSSSDGFFLSGSSMVSVGLELDATVEFQEADVLWPDTADAVDDDAAEFWWRSCRRVEEAAAAAAAAAACGKSEGRKPVVSSPIDIPTRVEVAAARRRPAAVLFHHRR
ncbi:uncharacterized protein LOC133929236 isoform X2 [Phragmites australis]|uniref:uncharacterized protein LOC133929236 isoform X2 n=1 Tax=Phragmites australis TaxID=29695 RepID=UPI002D788C48|nr:uncharacterized protein LOC133929236 isoform X2 [Phragmites australis]